jgi:allantoinase
VTDLLVRGGTVVLPGVFGVRADVAVTDGRIEAIVPSFAEPAAEEIDARGLHVLPGAIDAHVHFNEPGRADWEGWETGTAALAAGGATACVEMPLNAHPPTVDGAAFDLKVKAASASAKVDFALWGGLVPGPLDRLDELAARGVVGFKAFMCPSGIDDFAMADDDVLGEGMRRAAALGLPVAVHAERPERLGAPGPDWRGWAASRPPAAELEAIERALALAEETGCSLHVVHVSTGAGVLRVAEARARGVDATCETCPHYLALADEDMERLGTLAKCAPPLRPDAERHTLWRLLTGGDVAFVASDHSPCPPEMKTGGFDEAWGGIAGAQTTLALLITEGHWARRLPLGMLVDRATAAAARLRLRKGRLEPGADADLALVDLGAAYVLEELHDRHRANPFRGRELRGRVVRTILRGHTVYDEGRVAPEARGRLLKPQEAT